MILPNYKALLNYNKDKEYIYIANCMRYSLDQDVDSVDDNTYNLLCDFVFQAGEVLTDDYNDVPIDYQRLCDVVADLYFDCDWGYRNEDETINIENYETGFKTVQVVRTLDDKDIKEQNRLKVEMAAELYMKRIFY